MSTPNSIDVIPLQDVEKTSSAASTKSKRKIPKEERTTTPYLTKFERARVLGARALQLSMNAKAMVDTTGISDPLIIADKV
eukprot:MONOS_6705.1-p1 / transcript=MONOS_6705.1 / gene=MONOS_6705 / organism=Monocercomonoides_exilis_PA203 / gene_product=unspecified product / transcript_product=unspecified product / location=Mono_scaffold00216:27140-27496(-) / protein_length=80 / sequence_SO=supercontig / SO=protein_coding / is_pseudo=false